MDVFQGWEEDPTTLHKYLYANVDPVNGTDPSGYATLFGSMQSINLMGRLSTIALPSYSSFLSHVGAGLIAGGLTYGISDQFKEFIALNAPAMNEILEEKRVKERERVERRSKGKPVLFHYTGRGAALLIGATGRGFVTAPFRGLGTNGNTRPAGFYATDITPWNVSMTQAELSALFYGGNRNRDVSWFVAIDATSYSPVHGTSGEYVHHGSQTIGTVSVDVITIGPNLMLPGQ